MVLKTAFYNTRKKRQSVFEMRDCELVLQEIRESEFQRGLWSKYQRQYVYAKDVTFDEVMDANVNIMKKIQMI